MLCGGVKKHPMELHEDPQALVETFVSQHCQALGEFHGDIVARLPEVPDRFSDQGSEPRSITVSCTLLETLLTSRRRRQTGESTLKVAKGNGMGILLVDGKGTRIPVKKHPRKWDGSLLGLVAYVPGAVQLSIEEELGHSVGGEDGIAEPPGYRLYVLWWSGPSGGLGGAVLAAGVLTETVQLLYAATPLPPPIMEERSDRSGSAGGAGSSPGLTGTEKRRRDDDFGDVDQEDGGEEAAPPQTS
ncbi:hypothetical protein ACT17_12195 [Mycolicibacterium conceptionense]|jgi:hypothetical protein|uniref:Uncharacterized protein n=2 Tax=Mycolicibacterium conceptionense TaxID=451644 RepID=A0A0J8U9Y8_9MYCO|nr:hypothetical protein ACT17_12195 [Mycolicibacterium conceptionense]